MVDVEVVVLVGIAVEADGGEAAGASVAVKVDGVFVPGARGGGREGVDGDERLPVGCSIHHAHLGHTDAALEAVAQVHVQLAQGVDEGFGQRSDDGVGLGAVVGGVEVEAVVVGGGAVEGVAAVGDIPLPCGGTAVGAATVGVEVVAIGDGDRCGSDEAYWGAGVMAGGVDEVEVVVGSGLEACESEAARVAGHHGAGARRVACPTVFAAVVWQQGCGLPGELPYGVADALLGEVGLAG